MGAVPDGWNSVERTSLIGSVGRFASHGTKMRLTTGSYVAGAAFRRAVAAGEAHLLTVLGELGIGKSRLGLESANRLAGEATVLTGHCLSYGDGVDFWPLREALTQHAGGDSREAIRGLLDAAEDADLVAEIIAATLGLTDADTRREQVPWAFRRMFEHLARVLAEARGTDLRNHVPSQGIPGISMQPCA